jgi:hypothetical protein
VSVPVLTDGMRARIARVLFGGHQAPDDTFTEHWAAVALGPVEPEWWCYLAEVEGEAVGLGVAYTKVMWTVG